MVLKKNKKPEEVRLKRIEKLFDNVFDEPLGERRQDKRTQDEKDKEWLENFKKYEK